MDKTMTEEVARAFVEEVLSLRSLGVTDEEDLISALLNKFNISEDDVAWGIEMVSTGAFRAAIMSEGHLFPSGNLKIEDDPILKTAFKMHWIELRGMQHYLDNYVRNQQTAKQKRWWKNLFKR